MFQTYDYSRSSPQRIPLFSRWWINLRFHWLTKDKGPVIFISIFALVIAAFGYLMYSMVSGDSKRQDLTCLALNVYYEARGESLAGQLAVAEVTMNRVAARRYPATVCEVVYQKKWDRLRKRYVSAFSWTEFDVVPHPEGELWTQARNAAEAVYYRTQPPVLDGALHYHATYIKPSWARGKKPVARIGNHIFYK